MFFLNVQGTSAWSLNENIIQYPDIPLQKQYWIPSVDRPDEQKQC